MKILLVNNDKGWGGGQEQMKSLALNMAEQGCVPHFLCRANSPSARTFSALGFQVWDLNKAGKFFPAMIMDVSSMLRREQFDIVLVNREHDLTRTVLAWKLAFPFRKRGKLVVCYHTATARKQIFLGATDAVACVSLFVRDRLLAGNRRIVSPITILPNGIPVLGKPSAEKFTVGRQRRFFQRAGFPLIGMVGAFFKNQVELIEIIPLLKKEFPSIKVALVGDNTDPGLTVPLMEKAKLLGVADNVIFTGKVPHDRIADILFDLDLSVSTFRNEGFGLVHLESLSAGTPVICYNEGGQVDIFKGNDAGVLVDGGVEVFAEAVADLLRENKRRFAMGHEGVNLVLSSFSLATMGRKYLDFFVDLIGNDFPARQNDDENFKKIHFCGTNRNPVAQTPMAQKCAHFPITPGRKAEGGLKTRGRDKKQMTGKPLITVITVVYNGVDYLRQTIESVIHQQYDNLEYIIIDGGSSDGTLELIKSFDDEVDYWVSEPDCGIYDAMNKGIACSTGKYLLFLNARDELAVNLADIDGVFKGDHVLVYGKSNMLEDDRILVYVKGKRLKGSRKLITGTPLCHQAIFYKRDAVGRYNLDYKIIADKVLTYEMIEKYGIEQTLFIDRPVVNYFEGGFSRQNEAVWQREEIQFLRTVGWKLYAWYRQISFILKRCRRRSQ